MNKVIGASMIFVGGLVVFGGLTGRLPAMLAALLKPGDLVPGDNSSGGGASIGHPLDNLKSGIKSDPGRTAIDSIPIVGNVYEWLR